MVYKSKIVAVFMLSVFALMSCEKDLSLVEKQSNCLISELASIDYIVDVSSSDYHRTASNDLDQSDEDSPYNQGLIEYYEQGDLVATIDFNVGEDDLRDLVEDALGDGSVNIVRLAINRNTGRPRGFGHVVFHDEEMVEKAITALNDKEFFGRNLRVDKAQRKDQTRKHSVYLGNLAWDVSEDLVKEMIDDVVGEGLYTSVRVAVDRETGRHRGFGYVDFIEQENAEKAVAELNGLEVLGRQLRADHAVRNSDRREGGRYNNNRGDRGGYGDRRGSRDNYNNNGGDDSMSFE